MPHSEQGERLKVEFHISTRWGIGPGTVCFIRSAFCYLYDEGTGATSGSFSVHLSFYVATIAGLLIATTPATWIPSYGSEYYTKSLL